MKQLSLLQRFSALSFAIFLLLGVALGWVITSSFETNSLEHAKLLTAEFIRREAPQNFKGFDLTAPMEGPSYEKFAEESDHLKFSPDIQRVKVWNRDMVVVWSDEPQLVGKRFPQNKALRAALDGKLSSEIYRADKEEENLFKQRGPKLLELYVPVMNGADGRPGAVFEIYQDLEPLYRGITRQRNITWAIIFLGVGGAYLLCFGLVARASRSLESQTAEILDTNERYDGLVRSASDGIIGMDRSGNIVLFNRMSERMFGYSAEEVIGKPVTILMPKEYVEAHTKGMRRFIESGGNAMTTTRLELRGRRKDGSAFPFELSLSANGEGERLLVTGILRDITERKAAEESRLRMSMAIEQSADMVVITDAGGAIGYVNPSFERITGYSRDETVGRNMRLVKSGKHDADFYKSFWETIAGGNTWEGHFTNRKKDGSLYEEEVSVSPVKDSAGRIINYVAVKRDITREQALRKQVQTAQRIESVGTLAGGIAHDFNNALTGIMGFTDLVRMRFPKDPETVSDLGEISRCAERAAALTRQLLMFAQRQIVEPVNLNLNEVVTGLLKLVTKVVGEHIDVKAALAADLPTVSADRGQIEQVILNLCLNARDAMPSGGRLLLETTGVTLEGEFIRKHPYVTKGPYAMLAVSDTGTGMDEATQERIFEPFFTTKGPDKGTGLGMAVAYGIVKQHKGFIYVYSELGKGSTFRVYFPTIEAPSGAKSTGAAERIVGGKETILLAEDDASIRTLAERILMQLGYTVLSACDGIEAIDLFRRHREEISLAILDLVMPKMSGVEAIGKIREESPGMKSIFMSGYSVGGIHDRFVIKQDTPFLAKPFTSAAMARKVREVLDG